MAKTFKNFIAGKWVPAVSGKTFENRNPADTRDLIGRFPDSDKRDVEEAVRSAANGFARWSRTPAPARGDVLKRVGDLLVAPTQELEAAVGSRVHEVAGAEHLAAAFRIERIGNEPRGGAGGIVVIAACESGAADQQLARDPGADRPEHLVNDEAGGIGDRAADGNGRIGIINSRRQGPDRRLGRTVKVPQRSDVWEDLRGKRRW